MGYHITQTNARFHISARYVEGAYKAVRGLFGCGKETIRDSTGPHFRWVNTATALAATNLEEIMNEWRYRVVIDPVTGDVTHIEFVGEKSGDEDVLFPILAPFVTPDSYVEFRGEDDAQWRYVFMGSKCYGVQPSVTWGIPNG